MPVDFSTLTPQNPLNVGGIFAPHGFIAPLRLHFTGTGAAVGTAYGFNGGVTPASGAPAVGVTQVATGAYDIVTPPGRFVAPLVHPPQVPSGAYVDARADRDKTNAWTGITRIQFVDPRASGVAVRPPSGTLLDVLFFVSPTSLPGITPF